jgi:hypothetical protein
MDSEKLLDRILIRTASRAGAGFLGPVGPTANIANGLAADQDRRVEEIETALGELVDRKRLHLAQDHYSLTPIAWRRWESLRKDGAIKEVQIETIDPSKFIFDAEPEDHPV